MITRTAGRDEENENPNKSQRAGHGELDLPEPLMQMGYTVRVVKITEKAILRIGYLQ